MGVWEGTPKVRYEKGSRQGERLTTSQTGHFICCSGFPLGPLIRTWLARIISNIAVRSKLCVHFLLLTGSSISNSVSGHLMLMRSDATSISSSVSSPSGWPLSRLEDPENQVEKWGIGGAWPSGWLDS